ncbi:EFR3 [Nannizzia gypsea CBS 118893]|uniref:EFR3 n=1 Tax=Arthroderma gypseum (strain ATCC MYA-4604 / CBS 118893) TaxID=535722 RepID=E5R3C9_ARTGP|nr:EFR3 [Nannizzia gypsea CBS 118893]EFQ97944.1 EFR3 [Nannizzia gypsea CBS 118893]
MVHLVENLGVNATRYGLPVIMKLQSHYLDPSTSSSPLKAGSLVHGYFSAVVERFTLEGTRVGREIVNEVVRRRKNGLWLSKVQLPPLPAIRILTDQPLNTSDTNTDPAAQSNKAAYTPFTSTVELVSQIESAYNQSFLSPASSPASSPSTAAQGLAATLSFQPARQLPTTQLPSYVKEQMLSPWSREACLASIEQERTQSSSISGSKNGSVPARNLLNLTSGGKNGTAGSPTGTDSSHGQGHRWHRPVSASAAAATTANTTAPGTRAESRKDRRQSLTETPHPRSPTTASSSKDSTVRVNELRRVLSVMNNSNVRHPSPLRGHSRLGSDDASSAESMVTDTFSTSDAGFSSVGPGGHADAVLEKVQQSHSQPHAFIDQGKDKSIPPVPPLPQNPQSRKEPSRSSSARQSRSNSRSRQRSKSRTPSTSRRATSPQASTRSRKHSRSAADTPVEAWDPSLTQNPILLRSVSQSRRAEVDKLLGGIATPTAPDADTVPPVPSNDGLKGLLAPSRSTSGRRGIGPPPY